MPAPYPEEFRARAVSLVLDEGLPAAQVARDLCIAESGLRRWIKQRKVDTGQAERCSATALRRNPSG